MTAPNLRQQSLREQSLRQHFLAFVAERHPLALEKAAQAFDQAIDSNDPSSPSDIEALRKPLAAALSQGADSSEIPDLLTGVDLQARREKAQNVLAEDCDGFLRRAAIEASFTDDERREMLRGMHLVRAVDNRLKTLFNTGEMRLGKRGFQGKGFRSLGQEAIYAAALRLRRGPDYRGEAAADGTTGWHGDVVAPMIRDLGAALAMRQDDPREAVRLALNAQIGKAGPPMNGTDFHIGDWENGVLPPTAPLSISAMNASGVAFAMSHEAAARQGDSRVVLTFIGEGGTSLGEWHEAINVCATHRLPSVFCIENNQTALSTPVSDQTAADCFADKASGYGIPGLRIDGTDPEAVAAAFAWATERARTGQGPALIELVAMRICGHAHHDDMLYLGREPKVGWDYPELQENGYANPELFAYWSARDPLKLYAARLIEAGLVTADDVEGMKEELTELVEDEVRALVEAPWPDGEDAGKRVYGDQVVSLHHREVLKQRPGLELDREPDVPEVEVAPPFDSKGTTFLEAVMLGVGDALANDERVFVYGEDVGGQYGNSFLLLRPLLEKHGARIINSPLTEAGTLAVAIGAALAGLRPIAEIQFNDFIATGFNQLVNNAAKIRYRWGGGVPMVVRMPWGGLRSAGPYHSQNTEAWFYRTPGIKIVAPSTPADARALMAAAVADPDPVLYYEHIGLYRDPRVKQLLPEAAPEPLPLGRAALRRAGQDLAIVSYGAYVHTCLEVAEKLAADGIEAAVLDLRSLVPLDLDSVLRLARACGRMLIVHEDTRTGSIGESLAAKVQEEVFEYLDAPLRIVGALDTPVPYSPPLEQAFLPGADRVEAAARLLAGY